MINNQQYRRLMKEYQETGSVTLSAMRADLSRPTARKYLNETKTPEELQAKHTWRTRSDPLEKIWDEAMKMLEEAPELEAKSLFNHLLDGHPEQIQQTHLRTFQRRVKLWRLQHGPDKEVMFPQNWTPGRATQLDWTNANELQVRINGRPYDHLLCHVVLPFSNWEWATRCQSESLLSLRHGLQEAVHQLGRVTEELRVDHTTAATHQIGAGGRAFNPEFVSLCEHYRMIPRTIGIGCPNENGDVESSNGHLKRRMNQHLILRTSRDFVTESDYQIFLDKALELGNKGRASKLIQELALMQPLPPTRLAEYQEITCMVSSASTIRVKKVTYSVPARLIGSEVKVEVYENHLKIYSGRELLLQLPRSRRAAGAVLDYRHVIDHLLRKPGAFEGYRYREELFPSRLFREAYDRLIQDHGQRKGALEYLRLLKLSTEVETSDLELMLVEFVCPPHPNWTVEDLRKIVLPRSALLPALEELKPEWSSYDQLIDQNPEVSHVG